MAQNPYLGEKDNLLLFLLRSGILDRPRQEVSIKRRKVGLDMKSLMVFRLLIPIFLGYKLRIFMSWAVRLVTLFEVMSLERCLVRIWGLLSRIRVHVPIC